MTQRRALNAAKSYLAVGLSASLILCAPGPFAAGAFASVVAGAAASGKGAAASSAAGAVLTSVPNSAVNSMGLAMNLRLDSGLTSAGLRGLTANPDLIPARAAQAAARPAAWAVNSSPSFPAPAQNALALPIRARVPAAPGPALPPTPEKAGAKTSPSLTGMLKRFVGRYAPWRPKSEIAAQSRRLFDGANVRPIQNAAPSATGIRATPHRNDLRQSSEAGFDGPQASPVPKPRGSHLLESPTLRFGGVAALGMGLIGIFAPAMLPMTIVTMGLMGSILLHEMAHLVVLKHFGDPTPDEVGEGSLNPLRHVDLLGTILLPLASVALSLSVIGLPIVFGWAKPIPVDFNLIRQPKKRNAGWIALAGPLANLVLAATAGLGYLALPALGIAVSGAVGFVLSSIALMNVALFVFNMIPLPWLDGFKVLVAFLMPQKLYDQWIANPKFTAAYQRIYLHALNYEGPSWLLTKLNVRTQEQINGFTRAGSIALMGAFSAGLWMMLGVPFLFLALPCGYDYYCIRAKVRSEAAVEEMMDLMGEWGSVLSQIAEDYDVESEVNPRDVELNLVHAVDSLLEKLMKDEAFRRLSHQERVKRFMGEFPKFASEDLVNLAFQHDSPEKILEMLGDPRNGPYMARLRKWLETHEIFKKMENPTEKKKYLDAHEKEQKKRAIGETGFDRSRNHAFTPFFLPAAAGFSALAMSSLEGLLAWLAASGIVAAALMIGNLSGRESEGTAAPEAETAVQTEPVEAAPLHDSAALDKIVQAQNLGSNRGRFWVHFKPGVLRMHVDILLNRINMPGAEHEFVTRAGQPLQLKVEARDAVTAGRLAKEFARQDKVKSVAIHRDAYNHYQLGRRSSSPTERAPEPAGENAAAAEEVIKSADLSALDSVEAGEEIAGGEIRIEFRSYDSQDTALGALAAKGFLVTADAFSSTDKAYTLSVDGPEQAARLFSTLQGVPQVQKILAAEGLIAETRALLMGGWTYEAPPVLGPSQLAKLDRSGNLPLIAHDRYTVLVTLDLGNPDAQRVLGELGFTTAGDRVLGDSNAVLSPSGRAQTEVTLSVAQGSGIDAMEGMKAALRGLLARSDVARIEAHADIVGSLLGESDTTNSKLEEWVKQRAKIKRGTNSSLASTAHLSDFFHWAYVTVSEGKFPTEQMIKKHNIEAVSAKQTLQYDNVETVATPARTTFRVLAPSLDELTAIVEILAQEAKVTHISAHPAAVDALGIPAEQVDEIPAHIDRIQPNADTLGRLQVNITPAGTESAREIWHDHPAAQAATSPSFAEGETGEIVIQARDLNDAARIAASFSNDGRVARVEMHPDALEHLQTLIRLAGQADPFAKTAIDDELPAGEDLRISFKDGAAETIRTGFLKEHVAPRARTYRWEDKVLVVNLQQIRGAAGILSAARANENVVEIKLRGDDRQALEELKSSDPRAFEFGPESIAADARAGVDENAAVVITFSQEKAADDNNAALLGERFGLRLVEREFRGAPEAVLYETDVADLDHFMTMLGDAASEEFGLAGIERLRARPGSEADAALSELGEVEETPAEPVEIPRRDVHQEWLAFLQNFKMPDGSPLSPQQLEMVAMFLKPVQPPANKKKHPVIGRVKEMKRVIRVLTSPRGVISSVMLVGEQGTGKTAIIEGLAQLIEDSEYANRLRIENPDGSSQYLDIARLRGRWLLDFDISMLLRQDEPAKALGALLDLLPLLNSTDERDGNRLLILMDEIHSLLDHRDGSQMKNALKRPLRNGELAVAGTTTTDEWKRYFESGDQADGAFRTRFKRIDIKEPSVEETTDMLRGAKTHFEWRHDVIIETAALNQTAKLTQQFMHEVPNPRASFDVVIPEAAELARPDNIRSALALDIREGWRRLGALAREAAEALEEKAIASSIALPAEVFNRIADQVREIIGWYREQAGVVDGEARVTVDLIKRVIAEDTGVASGQLTLDHEDTARYLKMEAELEKDVVNQRGPILALAKAIRRNKSGLGDPTRPMGKFLFVGPTGTGKTHLVRMLSKFLFGSEEAHKRFDMTEYMERHAVARMIGAPPGYVGFEGGGELTEYVRRNPYTVLLFDEVEKAHPDVWNIFLQILDSGRLTDGQGRTVDFKNTIIVFTSNIGMHSVDSDFYADKIVEKEEAIARIQHQLDADAEITGRGGKINEIGELKKAISTLEGEWDQKIAQVIEESIKSRMKPEFINRLDQDRQSKSKWITFNRLTRENSTLITRIELKKFAALLSERHDTDLEFDDEVVAFLANDGFHPLYGARPLKEAIEKHIVDTLAEWVLARMSGDGEDIRGARVVVSMRGGKTHFEILPKEVPNIERTTLEGIAHEMTERVMGLVEGLAGDYLGERESAEPIEGPSESLFDGWLAELRRAAGELTGGSAAGDSADAPVHVFLPDQAAPALGAKAGETIAEHNEGRKDRAMRAAGDAAAAAARGLGWSAEQVGLVKVEAGRVGQGFIAQFVRHAKKQALAAEVEAPVRLQTEIGKDSIAAVVRSAHKMSDEEREFLTRQFTGTAPADFRTAQQESDRINFSQGGKTILDSNFRDLYRRLKETPGARLGYSTSEEGTVYWLTLPRKAPKSPQQTRDAKQPPASRGSVPGEGTGAIAHQSVEARKAKELIFRVLSSRHNKDANDIAIRIAAAESWAMLSTPADLPEVRRWIVEHKWATQSTNSTEIAKEQALLLAMTKVLERRGEEADIATLESISQRYDPAGHYGNPIRVSMAAALAALYVRTNDLKRIRALHDADGSHARIKEAAKLALGKIGTLADYARVKDNTEAEIELLSRWDPARLERDMEADWPSVDGDGKVDKAKLPTDKVTRLKLARTAAKGTAHPERDLQVLGAILAGVSSWDSQFIPIAEAFAEVAARIGAVGKLPHRFDAFLSKHGMSGYNGPWALLLAYLHIARRAGEPDVLPLLEDMMKKDPASLGTVYEQSYFETPMTWAMVVIRNGLFSQIAAPQRGENGELKPSKLQEMLSSKMPMEMSAALYLIGLARGGIGGQEGEAERPNQDAGRIQEIPDFL